MSRLFIDILFHAEMFAFQRHHVKMRAV